MRILLSIILFLCCVENVWAGIDGDGVNDYVSVPAINFNTINYGTISMWLKPSSATYAFFLCESESSTIDNFAGLLYSPTQSVEGCGWAVKIAGGWWVLGFVPSYTIPVGKWTNVILEVTATGNKIYINGVQQTMTYTYGSSTSAQFLNDPLNTDILAIGARIIPTYDNYFDGIIDEVAIWDTGLTDQEIKLLASSKIKRLPLQIQPSHLVAYWSLDDGPDGNITPITAKDLSGNGNDGQLTNGPIWKAEEVLSYP